jgi:hypothetical protein
VQGELEAGVVQQGVVPAADQHQLRQVGRSAERPPDEVVGAQFAVPVAAGEAAAFPVDRAEQLTQSL